MSVLQFDAVIKRFDEFTAIDNLSFAVTQGEVFGFLGDNGAGKTTSLRMMLDIIRPTSGRIEVLGKLAGHANRADLGFLPEESGLYKSMTALDVIVYFGRLKGMTRSDAKAEGGALLDRFELEGHAKTRVDKLSKGMAQKVQVATALVNQPRLLVFDEPFSGLDPVNQDLLEAEINHARSMGATVVFSTHVMQHAERLCDRLLFLAQGKKRFHGTLEEARAQVPAHLSVITHADPTALPGVEEAVANGTAEDGWQAWDIRLAAGHDAEMLLQHCTERGFPLRRFEQHHASLHDVFLNIVGPGKAQP